MYIAASVAFVFLDVSFNRLLTITSFHYQRGNNNVNHALFPAVERYFLIFALVFINNTLTLHRHSGPTYAIQGMECQPP